MTAGAVDVDLDTPLDLIIEQHALANGLRVVLAPDPRAPVVALSVSYDVGSRSEPEGRSGFAHLFEHLMFQGSTHLPKLAHAGFIQAAGGSFNAATHPDYTEFYQLLPAGGLERVLYLEADRMRGLALTGESLANQVEVVKQEIRGSVLSRPYGGFPHTQLAPVLFDTFPNRHDGYGSFEDLEAATVAEAEEFFARYYPPGNATLCVVGDFSPSQAMQLVERHFGALPGRPDPPRPRWWEPDLTCERQESYQDPLAPLPAVACGWRVPDPVGALPQLLPYVLLAELLATGELSRLHERMVLQDRSAVAVNAGVGLTGEWLTNRDPCAFLVQVTLPPGGQVAPALAGVQEELARLAEQGPTQPELVRARSMLTATLLRGVEPLLSRARWLAPVAQQRGGVDELLGLPVSLAAVAADQVAAAAAALVPQRRASVVVEPGAGR